MGKPPARCASSQVPLAVARSNSSSATMRDATRLTRQAADSLAVPVDASAPVLSGSTTTGSSSAPVPFVVSGGPLSTPPVSPSMASRPPFSAGGDGSSSSRLPAARLNMGTASQGGAGSKNDNSSGEPSTVRDVPYKMRSLFVLSPTQGVWTRTLALSEKLDARSRTFIFLVYMGWRFAIGR